MNTDLQEQTERTEGLAAEHHSGLRSQVSGFKSQISPSVPSVISCSSPIVLTDAPRVVELKREYYALDSQEEALKSEWRLATTAPEKERIQSARAGVEQRKKEIGQEIFRAKTEETVSNEKLTQDA